MKETKETAGEGGRNGERRGKGKGRERRRRM